MINKFFPQWFWSLLIGLNVFIFLFATYISKTDLMILSLVSGLSCYVSKRVGQDE